MFGERVCHTSHISEQQDMTEVPLQCSAGQLGAHASRARCHRGTCCSSWSGGRPGLGAHVLRGRADACGLNDVCHHSCDLCAEHVASQVNVTSLLSLIKGAFHKSCFCVLERCRGLSSDDHGLNECDAAERDQPYPKRAQQCQPGLQSCTAHLAFSLGYCTSTQCFPESFDLVPSHPFLVQGMGLKVKQGPQGCFDT